MPQGRRRSSRIVALLFALLVIPLGGAVAVGNPLAPPPQGSCTASAESKLGEARLNAWTEDPGAGSWKPWLVDSDDVWVPPPPAALSTTAAQERAELAAAALARSKWQVERAQHWDHGPAARAWEEMVWELLPAHTRVDPQMNPPRLARHLAIFEAAMHDALVIAWEAKYCYRRAAPSALDPGLLAVVEVRHAPSYPSEHAVAAGVASVILPQMFPLAPRAGFEVLAREAAESRVWAGANYRSDVEAGLALGRQVARLALAARAGDGSEAVWDGSRPPAGNCTWSPTPPAFRQQPLEPLFGGVRPWLMTSGDQFRPGPPPACESPEYWAQTWALYNKSKSLTMRERKIAEDYDVGPGYELPPAFELWHAQNLSLERRLTTMQHARMMSHVAAAVADAGIAAWDAKYAYWSDRPWHAIHARIDANWTPLLVTPPFPGYISGHATFAGAAQVATAHFFPSEAAALRLRADDNALSRFLGGVHIQADNEAGLLVGRQIGALVAQRLASG